MKKDISLNADVLFRIQKYIWSNKIMKEKNNLSIFQINDGTWGHLIKTVNPAIYTIEYERITGFSSKEEAERSYREYVNSYQTQIVKLKESRNMPFTFSEYLEHWYWKTQD